MSSYDQHGAMVLYNKTMFLLKHTRMTNFGIEFTIAFFNRNTWDAIHVITIYTPPKTKLFNFNSIFKTLSFDCPIIIIRDFNIDMLTKKE